MERPNRISLIVLQCALLVVVVRPEEVFNTTPPPIRTNFSCRGRATGFYADVEANCKVYYTCDDYGNKFSYRCPEETAFRQDALICDHAYLVDCQATTYSGLKKENVDKREDTARPPVKFGSSDNSRSFSRSFQVIQEPTKSTNKVQPGFVFSSSVFLRDLNQSEAAKKSENSGNERGRSIPVKHTDSGICDLNRERANIRNDVVSASSTVRPLSDRFDSKADSFNSFSNSRSRVPFADQEQRDGRRDDRTFAYQDRNSRKDEQHREASFKTMNQRNSERSDAFSGNIPNNRKESFNSYQTTKGPSRDFQRLSFANNRDYPYLETLRSIQANTRTTSTVSSVTTQRIAPTTTEIPVHALTLSLKPLVPNELEYDPYYPRFPTSTEAYYTPSHREKSQFRTSTQAPWSSIHFEIPAVLPDLNTLEDLVDRRKLFYIPRIKAD